MSHIRTFRTFVLLGIAMLGLLTFSTAVFAEEHVVNAEQSAPGGALRAQLDLGRGVEFVAIGITMGMACLAAGLAVGKIGAAAMGAAAEKPEILTKAIVFAGLGEGIAIFGLIVSIFLINKL